TDPAPEPQQPSDPEPVPYPQHPANPGPTQPATNPRQIRATQVWTGIALALLAHILGIAVATLLNIVMSSSGGFAVAFPVAELLVFAACIGGGIALLVRGDRGRGVGLLIGWAAVPIVVGGACVALIAILANNLGG
ncbi:MAG: hypothetical protein ACM30G_15735, partial [Micromonosporaceae bacterium]